MLSPSIFHFTDAETVESEQREFFQKIIGIHGALPVIAATKKNRSIKIYDDFKVIECLAQ